MATTKKPTSRTAATRTTKKPQSTTIKNRLAAAKAADARKTAAKPAAKSAAKPAARAAAKPVAKPAARPAAKSVARPAARPAAKAVAKKTAAKPAAQRPAAVKDAQKRPVAAAPKQRKTAKAGNVPTDIVERLRLEVKRALEELKAKDISEIDVRGKTSIADYIVIASGTSTRHVKSISDEVVKYSKKIGMMPLGVEGQREAEWVLVDLGDIVVHIMLPRVREFYGLERLWTVGDDEQRDAAFG